MSPGGPSQLGLRLPHVPRYGSDFIAAATNEQARLWLARTPDWPDGRLVLWGEPGTGKTHLLHLWAERCGAVLVAPERGNASCALDSRFAKNDGSGPRPLAIDDADGCDERMLLHTLNDAAASRTPVLLAARTPPARWTVELPDLASRLRAVMAVAIGPPEDGLLRALLARLLADRQTPVARPVQEWLLRRLPRTAGAIRSAVERLDQASLDAGRPITRMLAAHATADLLGSASLASAETADDAT